MSHVRIEGLTKRFAGRPPTVAVTSWRAEATGPVTSSAAPRTDSNRAGATSDKASRNRPTRIPAISARKLKNSEYCARRDQPGRAVATASDPP